MDFTFDNTHPIYLQIAEQLEHYIITGQFPPGSKLPPVRDFAAAVRVNPNTFQRALQELETKQLIVSERTNGKFVTNDTAYLHQYRFHLAENKIRGFLNEMHALGLSCHDIIKFLQALDRKEHHE